MKRGWHVVALSIVATGAFGVVGACSSSPSEPDSGVGDAANDVTGPDVSTVDAGDASQTSDSAEAGEGGDTGDGGDAATNPYNAMSKSYWSTFDLTTVNAGALGFEGAAFDGKYVYFAPYSNGNGPQLDGLVARFDTTATFNVAGSWSTFDVTTVNANAKGFTGAAFDGKYVYLVPYMNVNGTQDGIVARFDTTATFTASASWSTFDVSTVNAGAKGFHGAVFDGKYVYLVPYVNGSSTSGVVARLDTTATFTSSASWSTFDVSTVNADASGFVGAVFDGRYVYLVPYFSTAKGYDGIVARFDTKATFTTASSWSTFDVSTVNANATGFQGAAFDGQYVYLVPNYNGAFHGNVARFDTTATFTAAASWSTFNVATVNASAKGFQGAAFDGRYVYFVPGGNTIARLDTTASFTTASSWSTFDVATLDATATSFFGAVFDGSYVYLVPGVVATVARFDARSPPSMPKLPGWNGSFF